MVIIGIYFYFVKKIEPILLASTLITIVLVIFIIFTPESPKFLYEKGKMKEFKEALMFIAKFNGKEISIEEIS